MNPLYSFMLLILTVLIFGLLAGCNGDKSATPLAPFQPEIVNNPDNFAFQATGVQNVSTTLSYVWQNSGTQAIVNHSSAIVNGSAIVTVYDSNDSLVYTNGLLASGDEQSTIGTTGSWHIVVILNSCSGTLNFRVQKL